MRFNVWGIIFDLELPEDDEFRVEFEVPRPMSVLLTPASEDEMGVLERAFCSAHATLEDGPPSSILATFAALAEGRLPDEASTPKSWIHLENWSDDPSYPYSDVTGSPDRGPS